MKKQINFGVGIPTGEEGLMYPIPFAGAKDNILIAKKAEAMGFDSVWGNDHVLTQKYVWDEFGCAPRYYAPLITLSSIAQQTERIKLCTALLVAPFRHPVMIAKEIATLDQLSDGRVLMGIGIGAYIEEFRKMFGSKVEGFMRGEMLDECLASLQLLWQGKPCSFSGKYYEFNEVESFPTPLQTPLPIYIGGNSPEGRRRVAQLGSGWLPAVMPVHQIQEGICEIAELAAQNGRDIADIDIAPQFHIFIGKTMEDADERFKQTQLYKHIMSLKTSTLKNQQYDFKETGLVGSLEYVKERIQQYVEVGVTTFSAMIFSTNTLEEMFDMMQLFSEEIMPSFK